MISCKNKSQQKNSPETIALCYGGICCILAVMRGYRVWGFALFYFILEKNKFKVLTLGFAAENGLWVAGKQIFSSWVVYQRLLTHHHLQFDFLTPNIHICPTTETLGTHHHLWCIGITIRILQSLSSFPDFFCSLVTTEWTHFNLPGLLVCWSGSVLNAWRYELWLEVMVYTNWCAQFSYRCFWGSHEVFLEGSVVWILVGACGWWSRAHVCENFVSKEGTKEFFWVMTLWYVWSILVPIFGTN